MGFCDDCKFYQLEKVFDPYSARWVTQRMCIATENNGCPAEMTKGELAIPCPICGREMREGDEMCGVCLKHEMAARNWAANERQRIRDILEAS